MLGLRHHKLLRPLAPARDPQTVPKMPIRYTIRREYLKRGVRRDTGKHEGEDNGEGGEDETDDFRC